MDVTLPPSNTSSNVVEISDPAIFPVSDHLPTMRHVLGLSIVTWNVLYQPYLEKWQDYDKHIGKYFPQLRNDKITELDRRILMFKIISILLKKVDIIAMQEFPTSKLETLNQMLTLDQLFTGTNYGFIHGYTDDIAKHHNFDPAFVLEAPLQRCTDQKDTQVIIYNKEKLSHSLVASYIDSYGPYENGQIEFNKRIMFIRFTKKATNEEFIFINTHVVFGKNDFIESYVTRSQTDHKLPVIFAGDMNTEHASDNKAEYSMFVMTPDRTDCIPMQLGYTHITPQGSKVLFDSILFYPKLE